MATSQARRLGTRGGRSGTIYTLGWVRVRRIQVWLRERGDFAGEFAASSVWFAIRWGRTTWHRGPTNRWQRVAGVSGLVVPAVSGMHRGTSRGTSGSVAMEWPSGQRARGKHAREQGAGDAGWAGGDGRDGPKTKTRPRWLIHFFLFFFVFYFPFSNQFKCSFELQIYLQFKNPSMNMTCLIYLFIILFNQMLSNIKFIHTNIENGYFKKYIL
jgi:hypothetical protein